MYNMKNCDRKSYRDTLCVVKRERERARANTNKEEVREKKKQKRSAAVQTQISVINFPRLVFAVMKNTHTYMYSEWEQSLWISHLFPSIFYNRHFSIPPIKSVVKSIVCGSLHKFEWVVDMIWFFFRLMELKNRVFESNHFRCYYKVLIRIPQRNSRNNKKNGINMYSWHTR